MGRDIRHTTLREWCDAIDACLRFIAMMFFFGVVVIALPFGRGLQAGMRQAGYDLHDRVLVELGFILVGVCMLFLGSWMEAGWIFLTGVALTAIGTATLVVGLFYDLCYGFGPTKHESNVSTTALIANAGDLDEREKGASAGLPNALLYTLIRQL